MVKLNENLEGKTLKLSIYTYSEKLANALSSDFPELKEEQHYADEVRHAFFDLPFVQAWKLLDEYDKRFPLEEYEVYLKGKEKMVRLRTYYRGSYRTLTKKKDIKEAFDTKLTTAIELNN